MKSVHEFSQKKSHGEKISMVTCYDYWSAQIINQTSIDSILVGDSLAMVMHGHETTLSATVSLMALHTEAVHKGAPDKLIVGDLPFLSYRKDLKSNMEAVEKIMQSGAQAVKLEGADGNLELIRHISSSGVPVMGHLGLTPQSIHQMGGFKVQGRGEAAMDRLISEARSLEEAGCFSLVLECVPTLLAQTITEQLQISTIGIGAGVHTDGQILVLQDLLGFNPGFKPKFLRPFLNGFEQVSSALESYHGAVTGKTFPSPEESYE